MSKFKSTASKGKNAPVETAHPPIVLPEAFLDKLMAHDIPAPPKAIAPKDFTRWGDNNRYYATAIENGILFGDWVTGTKETWFPADGKKLSAQDKEKRTAAIAAAKQQAEKLRQEEQVAAAIEAQKAWEKFSTTGKNAYLTKKQVKGLGIRYEGSKAIIVPVRDMQGTMSSLQYIYADGAKRFFPKGRVQGCFHAIGEIENSKPVLVAEGYATAASGHMATEIPAVVAFNAGNLLPVTKALREKYPDSPILIMGDDDCWKKDEQGNALPNTGRIKADEAAQLYGCHIAFPIFSEASQEKQPTDFNDLHCLEEIGVVKKQLLDAFERMPSPKIPPFFQVRTTGVYYLDLEGSLHRLCWPPVHVVASAHDENGQNHGIWVHWTNPLTGKLHTWAMPLRFLGGHEQEIRQKLLDEGVKLDLSFHGKTKLLEYFQVVEPYKKLMSISRVGWHKGYFALPDVVYPNDKTKVLQTDNLYFKGFSTSGTLEEWQQHIAQPAQENTRLMLALSMAFAPPLLDIVGEESGAVHLVGGSSLGKTTALRIAGSVWGGGGDTGFVRQWRATANALEGVAETHRDCLLPLDELSQADARSVGDSVYMLANNQGKSRMSSGAKLRKEYEWRLLILSSGEVSLEEKLSEAQRKPLAGMDVRFINLPADAGKGHGIADTLHHFSNGDIFARHFKEASGKYYGTAIRAFLAHLVEDKNTAAEYIVSARKQFSQKYLPTPCDGQVHRVAGRFGLIAAAGELAIRYGVLPFPAGEAMEAVAVCFKAWLDARGSTGALEVEQGIARVREYLQKYGENKFVLVKRAQHSEADVTTEPENRVYECMGYREVIEEEIHYFILPAAFKEICRGSATQEIARTMGKRKFLKLDTEGKTQISKRFPGLKKPARAYHILPALFVDEGAKTNTEEKDNPSEYKVPKPKKFEGRKR